MPATPPRYRRSRPRGTLRALSGSFPPRRRHPATWRKSAGISPTSGGSAQPVVR
jgi:hypothetical protein